MKEIHKIQVAVRIYIINGPNFNIKWSELGQKCPGTQVRFLKILCGSPVVGTSNLPGQGPSLPVGTLFQIWLIFSSSRLPIFIFLTAYMCQHNTFLLYSAIKEKTEVSWTKSAHISVSISCIVNMGGCLTFTGFTLGRCYEDTSKRLYSSSR